MKFYLLRRQIYTFILLFIPVTFIISFIQIVKILNILHLDFLPISTYFELLKNSFFVSAKYTIPLISFISLFIVTGLLVQNKELQAMYSLGVSKGRFTLWYLIFPFLLTIFSLINIFKGSPDNFRSFKYKLVNLLSENFKKSLHNAKELTLSNLLLFYFDEFSNEYYIMFVPEKNFLILKGSDIKALLKGDFIDFQILNGTGYILQKTSSPALMRIEFESFSFQISSKFLFPTIYGVELNELTLRELLRFIKNFPHYHFLKTDLWKRLSLGFSPILLSFFALFLPSFMEEEWREKGAVFAVIFIFWFYFLIALTKKIGYAGFFPALAFIGPSLGTFLPFVILWFHPSYGR